MLTASSEYLGRRTGCHHLFSVKTVAQLLLFLGVLQMSFKDEAKLVSINVQLSVSLIYIFFSPI